MTRTVIVPLDGSEGSERALPMAQLMAKRTGGTIKLLSVVEISTEFDAWIETAPFSLEEELDSWLAERREYLNDVAAQLGEGVETEVRVGRPAEEIQAAVDDAGDALVVMASHGRGGLQQIVLGSVALKVIQDMHAPVIAVHMHAGERSAPSSIDRILFPTDGTDFSESIIDRVLAILGEPKPSLHLMRVAEYPSLPPHVMGGGGLVAQYIEATRELYQQHLDELADRLREAGYDVSVEMREGKPGRQILDAADSSGADMIAMATHGRGNIGRLLLGSVAQHVLSRTQIPLLLMHPELED